jgi:hypothetical protein
MAGTNVDIKIIAEFLGKTAFKQAETATNKLNKTVKSLGSSFGVAFGGAALGYAIKSTIRDFADAERETVALTNTVKNLGLAFDAPVVDAYVNSIGKLYGVTGAQAVPAMQALLSATGSVTKSTEIMNVALDLAASRSADVGAVASDLANAYVGNTKGLNQYRLGLTKAELAAMTFDEILAKISKDTLGAADEAANSLSGKLAILSEITNQAKERIGGGLVNALGGLAGPNGAGGAAQTIENLSIKLTNAIEGFGYLVREVKIAQPILVAAGVAIGLAWAPWFTAISVAALAVGALGNALKKNKTMVPKNTGPLMFPTGGDGGYKKQQEARKKAEQDALLRNKKLAQSIKDQAKAAADLVKKKKLANAIDKANLLLGKGEKLFDIEAIQYNAALINQADQLGKTTNAAQMLAIANDVARLNVKKSMYELEQAIAAGDIKAIEAATAKLNEDLKILSVLTGQKATVYDIKSILDSLKPKDLINLDNLNAALNKIQEMLKLLAQANAAATAKVPTSASLGSGIPAGDYIAPIPMSVGLGASTAALIEASEAIQARADAFSMLLDLQTEADTAALAASSIGAAALNTFNVEDIARSSLLQGLAGGAGVSGAVSGSRYAAQAAAQYQITINAGLGSDPEAIARGLEDVLNQSSYRGTSVNRGSGNYIL